jgi:hypothetical protein
VVWLRSALLGKRVLQESRNLAQELITHTPFSKSGLVLLLIRIGMEVIMSPVLVALCYGSATLLSLFLLWHFGTTRWFWHVLSVAAALTIGFIPGNEFWSRPEMTLLTGWFFVALFIWGAAAPAFTPHHHTFHLWMKHR